MIHTVNLLPGFGPRANPLLFGVSEGLLRLFPLPAADRPPTADSDPAHDARPNLPSAPASATTEA